jgi:putative MATE family efflux protein
MIRQAQPRAISAVDITGSTGRVIWKISGPVMLSSVLFTIMSTVDMFWVGRLGHREIAAVALAGSVLGVLQALAGMVSVGTLATCARFAGADDRDGVVSSLSHSIGLSGLIGLVVALATVPFGESLMRIFGAETTVVNLGTPYLELSLIVLPSFFVSMVLAAAFQALGDTRTPMWISLVTNIVHLILDPFLILGWLGAPRLGVFGAAIATAFSQVLGMTALFWILYRKGLVALRRTLQPRVFGSLLTIGAPASLQAITRPLTGMLLFRIVTSFGTAAIAAFGVGLRILNIMYIYLNGLGAACQTLVGQNLGARRPEDALRVAGRVLKLSLFLQIGVMLVLFVWAGPFIRIFNANPDVVRYGASYLHILAGFLIVLGPSTAWSGAQFGAGATRPTMVAALAANWLVKIPLAAILSRMSTFGLAGVWLGIGVSILIEAAIVGVAYFQGGWRHKELEWRS